ncbi:hypothetical protein [Hymenobacter tenuis]
MTLFYRYRFLFTCLFSLVLLTLTACSKDSSEPEPKPNAPLEGTWVIKFKEYNSFRAQGALTENSGKQAASGTEVYTITPSLITFVDEPQALAFEYSYTRANDILTLRNTRTELTYAVTIVELTTNTLILQEKVLGVQGDYTIVITHMVRQ